MNYEEAFDYLYNCSTKGSVYGLERVKRLADEMNLPDKNCRLIHVAGTNGKGSVSRMIASILTSAGYRTGIFNSPFLSAPTEYMCVDGVDANREEFAEEVSKVRNACKKIKEKDPAFMMPTEFEMSFCATLSYFKTKKCEFAVIECGLGGLTDATNIIPAPELAIITNIGIDHTGLLGNTVQEIAAQKAGIIKHGCDVIAYPSCNEALNIIAKKCISEDCNFFVADNYISEYEEYIGLPGNFQKANAAVAVKAVEILNKRSAQNIGNTSETYNSDTVKNVTDENTDKIKLINSETAKTGKDENTDTFKSNNSETAKTGKDENTDAFKANNSETVNPVKDEYRYISTNDIRHGLASVRWPGRFEIIRKNPYIIIDGGHNNQCIEALTESLDSLNISKAVFVIGVMADKSYQDMFVKLSKYAEYVITTEPANPRRLDCCESLKYWNSLQVEGEAVIRPSEAVKRAVDYSADRKNIVVAGSLYMMGEVRETLKSGRLFAE